MTDMTAAASAYVPKGLRRDAAVGLTDRKRHELEELARRCARARERFIADYWDCRHASSILAGERALVEARRHAGWPLTELSAHQNKVCLETALGILRGSWRAAIRRAIDEIRADPSWTRTERDDALRILRSPQLLQSCLDRSPEASAACITATRVIRRLRRLVIRSRGPRPRPSARLWFDLDCNLYRPYMRPEDRRFRGAWLAVSGVRKGQRINVPLAGRGIDEFTSRTARRESYPSIRVMVDRRITFLVLARVRVERRDPRVAAGLDKGYNTLLTLTTDNPDDAEAYGAGSVTLIASIADRAAREARGRQRLAAYQRSVRGAAPAKARRMRLSNLGRVKSSRRTRNQRGALREQINRTLNRIFREHSEIGVMYCEDLSFRSTSLSRLLNKRLGRWLKGYLQDRLTYKAELNGVELKVVNAAYTSQACPQCWFTSERNRRGEWFECADCGYTGSADAVAATNVLRRGSDPAITRYMSLSDVKQILEARWRSARIGRAWGSNEVMPATDALQEPVTARAANSEMLADGGHSSSIRRRSIDAAAATSPPVLRRASATTPRAHQV